DSLLPSTGIPLNLRCSMNRGDDILIAGAAAQIAGDHLPGLILVRIGVFPDTGRDGRDETRGTETALQGMAIHERVLHGAEGAVPLAAPTDRGQYIFLDRDGEHQARTHRLPIDQHGACAADAVFTAEMSSGQTDVVP